MNEETNTPSIPDTTRLGQAFDIPGRLVNHLRLFTDLDIRTYLSLLAMFRPAMHGSVMVEELATALSATVTQIRRSLLRLMAFGIIGVRTSIGKGNSEEIELLSEHVALPLSHHPSQLNAAHLAEALGDSTNLPIYQLITTAVSPDIVRQALVEALEVPESRIRKSRAALFIHLIRKYAKPSDTDSIN